MSHQVSKITKDADSLLCEQLVAVLHQFCSFFFFFSFTAASDYCLVLLLSASKKSSSSLYPHPLGSEACRLHLFTRLQKAASINLCLYKLCSSPLTLSGHLLSCLCFVGLFLAMNVPKVDTIFHTQIQTHMLQIGGSNHFP